MIWGSEICLWFVCVQNISRKIKLNEVDIYMFKVKKKSDRASCEIYPKLTIKVQQFRHQDNANFVILVSLL